MGFPYGPLEVVFAGSVLWKILLLSWSSRFQLKLLCSSVSAPCPGWVDTVH